MNCKRTPTCTLTSFVSFFCFCILNKIVNFKTCIWNRRFPLRPFVSDSELKCHQHLPSKGLMRHLGARDICGRCDICGHVTYAGDVM